MAETKHPVQSLTEIFLQHLMYAHLLSTAAEGAEQGTVSPGQGPACPFHRHMHPKMSRATIFAVSHSPQAWFLHV